MTANIFCLSLFGRPWWTASSGSAVFLSVCGFKKQAARRTPTPNAGCH